MSRIAFVSTILISLLGPASVRGQVAGSSEPAASVAGVEGIPLRPRGSTGSSPAASQVRQSANSNALTTVVGGLAICLGIFFLIVWATKRQAPPGMARLPVEVVESLGRLPLSGRQHLQLLRIGRKLVLLDVTPGGAETLTEITDPAEVDRLVGLCQQAKPNSVSASFREVLTEYEKEPAAKGFLGNTRPSDWELASRGPGRGTSRQRTVRREDSDG